MSVTEPQKMPATQPAAQSAITATQPETSAAQPVYYFEITM
jgi:hypothetical protein